VEQRLDPDHALPTGTEHAACRAQAQTWVNQAHHLHPWLRSHRLGGKPSGFRWLARLSCPRTSPVVSSRPLWPSLSPASTTASPAPTTCLSRQGPGVRLPGPERRRLQHYTGSGRIPAGSFLNRLALTLRFGDIKFFTSSAITGESRVILNDNIKARLSAAAPFLTFDQTPTCGRRRQVYWIADAYTTTNRYPYSQPNGNG